MLKILIALTALAGLTLPAGARPSQARAFKVGPLSFIGTSKSICVIKGRWRDGQPFRYEAWDECNRMVMREARMKSVRTTVPLGERKRDTQVSDIPRNAQVFEISNGYSRVLVFRDVDGNTREILSGD